MGLESQIMVYPHHYPCRPICFTCLSICSPNRSCRRSDAHQKLSLLSLPFLSKYKIFILNYVCNLQIAHALACLNKKKLYDFFKQKNIICKVCSFGRSNFVYPKKNFKDFSLLAFRLYIHNDWFY